VKKGKLMIEMHKNQIEWFKAKIDFSDYGVAWISFIKEIVFGLIIYHYFLSTTH
tara:strand:- start:462 stop:623 length:162 start_codon:yes stop_codon:yes gene_type:complete